VKPASIRACVRNKSMLTGDPVQLACPTCGARVDLTFDTLWRHESVSCPTGHPVHIAGCAGLSEVARFLLDLDGVSRRLARQSIN
jgi:hypothetical protein